MFTKEVYKRTEFNFPKVKLEMHPKAIKCKHCEDGYRHQVGNCVLCNYGLAPFSEGDFYGTMPDIDDHYTRLQKLMSLNSMLLMADPQISWPRKDGRPHWCYDLYIGWKVNI